MNPRADLRVLGLALALLLAGALAANAATDSTESLDAEKKLIEAAARDYVDGWYEGNVERMERALHPDLAKRRVSTLPNGRAVLQTLSRNTMVEYTRLGSGKKSRREGQVNEVVILDVSSHTASVKAVSYQFIDYLHLAKTDGEWRIVNVLWELREEAKPGS